MLAAERLNRITEIIKDTGFVKVEDLAETFDVSEMTIRRDLEKLESAGVLRRNYGGASYNAEQVIFDNKNVINIKKKKLIAEKCATLVKESSTVYLDTGTTTMEIARTIYDIPEITIVTCDLQIAFFLSHFNTKVFMLGGELLNSSRSVYGLITQELLDNFQFDISFISTKFVDKNFDIFLPPPIDKAFLKRKVIENSEKSYLVVDSSKFYRKSLFKQCNISSMTGIISDKEFSEEELAVLAEKKVSVYIARDTN